MLNEQLLSVLVRLQTATRRQDGQGALEYMAMVVAMVVLIYAGFRIAGVNIFNEASTFVQQVLDGEGPG